MGKQRYIRVAQSRPHRNGLGVSLGVLLSAYVFLKDRIGERLLGAIGHADLPRFARSYAPWFRPVAPFLPVNLLSDWVRMFAGPRLHVALAFLGVLNELASDRPAVRAINPMTYADRIGPGRRLRFLVGGDLAKGLSRLAGRPGHGQLIDRVRIEEAD